MPADGDVIGRVGENHLRPLALQDRYIRVLLGCIGAEDAVIAELPEVTRPGDHGSLGLRRRELVEQIRLARHCVLANDEVDFGDLEAGDGEVELGRQLEQCLKLDGQDLFIPARLLSQPVVGEHVGALLGLAHVREANGRHLAHAEQLGCLDTAVPGDDETIFVDEDGVVEAERLDAVGDLVDLPARMRARVARVGLQLREGMNDDLQVVKRPEAA